MSEEEKKVQEHKQNVVVFVAEETFFEVYSPANDEEKEVVMKTTKEIQTMFSDFTGVEQSSFEIAKMMVNRKFEAKLIGDEFMWQLKKN